VTADRTRVTLRRTSQIVGDWRLDLTASYRRTEHDLLAPPSDERLKEWSASARRSLAADWTLELGYYGAKNDSPIIDFAYDRGRTLVGFGKAF
jgi:hypothetical protein